MARARLLKPDYFEDEKLTAMPFGARILFTALWCLADREGRLEDRPSRIAAFAFPPMGNEKTQANGRREVAGWIGLLVTANIVRRYEVEGESYLLLLNWEKHQRVHPNEPKSSLPPPLETIGNQAPPKVTNVAGSGSGSGSGNKAEAVTETRDRGDVPPRFMVGDCDPVAELCAKFAKFGSVTASTSDAVAYSINDFSLPWVEKAIKRAAGAKYDPPGPSWNYVESILDRWKKQGQPDDERELEPRTNARQSGRAAGSNAAATGRDRAAEARALVAGRRQL